MKTTVAFPFRARCEYRVRSLPYVQAAYRSILPDAEHIVVDTGHEVFNRAAARNEAVRRAADGVVVIADGDILPSAPALMSAVSAARSGGFHLGYDYYRALLRESSERYYRLGGDASLLPMSHDSRDSTAGIIVIRCDEWQRAGGMDERFHGWGFEDSAFACAVRTMIGPLTYHPGTVNHLWHPSDVRPRTEQYQRNKALYDRYAEAEGDVDAMHVLIVESARNLV